MDLTTLLAGYIVGMVLVCVVLAFGQGAGWWHFQVGGSRGEALFILIPVFWPVFVVVVFVALIVFASCWLAHQAGERLRK